MRLLLFLVFTAAAFGQQVDYVNQVKRKPALDPREFQFTRTNGLGATGDLSVAGAHTVTLIPCPLGVDGTHTVAANLPHLLYITGGAGIAEAVPITGGTCTSGAAIGTITLTAANTHSGAWTIKSNTSGVQEAIYVAGATGAVRMPGGTIDLWGNTASVAALTVPDGYSTSVRGSGVGATTIKTHGTTNDWFAFEYVSAGGFIDTGDYSMLDATGTPHTTGKMLSTRYRTDGDVSGIYLNHCYNCLSVERNARASYHDITIGTYHYALWIHCGGAHIATCQSTGSYSNIVMSSAVSGGDTLRVEAPTAGIAFTNVSMGSANNSANNAVHLVATDPGDPLNELMFANCIIDGHQVGVRVTGNGSAYNSNSLQFIGGRVNSAQYAVVLESYVDNFSTNGTILVSAGTGGVGVDRSIFLNNNVRNASFLNSPMIATDGDACLLELGVATNIIFSGNKCGEPVGSIQPQYAFIVQGTIAGFEAKGNNLTNTLTGILNNSGALAAPVVWANNTGIDNVIPAVASVATLAFPLNPIFTITGTTGVGAVTFPLGAGAIGASGLFTTTTGAVTFAAGATIGNTLTTSQNVPVSWYWDGTKVWLEAGGGGGGGSGTVTSVGWTGGLVSVANPTTTPAFTVAGTSGGLPYFSSASTWASSGLLGANLPLFGGGAGAAPIAGTRSGNTTQVVTTTGSQTSGNCVSIDANGNHVDSGVPGCASIPMVTTRTSSTVLSIGSDCVVGAANPCVLGVGPVTYTFTAAVTATVTTGSGLAYIYLSGADGRIKVGIPAGITSIACSGCDIVTPITQFPVDSLPLMTWNVTSNTWDATGTNQRSILRMGRTFTAGSGVALSQTGANVIISATGGGWSDYQKKAAAIVMDTTDKTLYTSTMPAAAVPAGKCLEIRGWIRHTAGTGSVNTKLWVGSASFGLLNSADLTLWRFHALWCNDPGSTVSQQMSVFLMTFSTNNLKTASDPEDVAIPTSSENTANSLVVKLTGNGAGTESITPFLWELHVIQ